MTNFSGGNHTLDSDRSRGGEGALVGSSGARSVHVVSYRCFTAMGSESVPLFGDFGLAGQLGSVDYARPRKFRERLERWLGLVRTLWPSCPAHITSDGDYMLIQPALALAAKGA